MFGFEPTEFMPYKEFIVLNFPVVFLDIFFPVTNYFSDRSLWKKKSLSNFCMITVILPLSIVVVPLENKRIFITFFVAIRQRKLFLTWSLLSI